MKGEYIILNCSQKVFDMRWWLWGMSALIAGFSIGVILKW